jgi:hypothetical protein
MRHRNLLMVVVAIIVASGGGVSRAAGGPGSPAGGRSTSVLGAAWNDDNSPIKGAHLRLRNVLTGSIEATAIANDAGQFTFEKVEGGTYVVELVSDGGRILAVGHPFTIAPGETIATFVRLGTRIPWFQAFFSNAATAATSAAASQGITAMAPVARPASAGR